MPEEFFLEVEPKTKVENLADRFKPTQGLVLNAYLRCKAISRWNAWSHYTITIIIKPGRGLVP